MSRWPLGCVRLIRPAVGVALPLLAVVTAARSARGDGRDRDAGGSATPDLHVAADAREEADPLEDDAGGGPASGPTAPEPRDPARAPPSTARPVVAGDAQAGETSSRVPSDLNGYGGLRLDPTVLPDRDITSAEIEADYDAVIGLEPETMRLVGGFAPERLSLVRKARGAEDHKGNGPIIAGDDADRCLVSWLASATDAAACARALDQP